MERIDDICMLVYILAVGVGASLIGAAAGHAHRLFRFTALAIFSMLSRERVTRERSFVNSRMR